MNVPLVLHPHCPLAPHQPFQNRTIPRKSPSLLPPLSKGGGLTARHKLSLCCVLLAIHPPFLFTKLFAVKTEGLSHHPSLSATSMLSLAKGEVLSPEKIRATTGGIAAPLSLAPHQPFRTRTIPRLAPHAWLPCQRELDCDKAISYYKSQHSAISSTLIFVQSYLSQD